MKVYYIYDDYKGADAGFHNLSDARELPIIGAGAFWGYESWEDLVTSYKEFSGKSLRYNKECMALFWEDDCLIWGTNKKKVGEKFLKEVLRF